MIERLRKKPVEVEAMLWDGDPFTAREIQDWVGEAPSGEWGFLPVEELAGVNEHAALWVAHQKTWSPLPVGHRVVKELNGTGFYPLSPEGCEAAYEPAALSAHPEATCGRCGGPNVTWSAPSPLWNAVMRGGSINGVEEFDGIVCPVCFAQLAEERGIAELWRFSAEVVRVELETVTPSGRTWDEAAWLWRESTAPVVNGQCPGLPMSARGQMAHCASYVPHEPHMIGSPLSYLPWREPSDG